MKPGQESWVYMMSNETHSVLYVGVTSDLARRVAEHKAHAVEGFAARYNAVNLVYCESCSSIEDAIKREKQLKGWRREKKNALIAATNPAWKDLAAEG